MFDVLPGDTMLLCSNGTAPATSRTPASFKWRCPPTASKRFGPRLVEAANERGGSDNITTVLVRAYVEVDARPDRTAWSASPRRSTRSGHVVLFSELDMKELVKVSHAFRPVEYQADQVVLREGDVSETLFVIVRGAAS